MCTRLSFGTRSGQWLRAGGVRGRVVSTEATPFFLETGELPSASTCRATLQRPCGLTVPLQWIAAVLVTALLVGCGQTSSDKTSTAVVGTTEDFETVNELIALGSSFNDTVLDSFFLQLVAEQPNSQKGPATFEPRLATRWEFSDDRSTLDFELRDDVFWSDGTPVTAADVHFSWQAQVSPEVAWSYAYSKEAIADVEIVDDFHVRFHFSAPSATQLEDANEGVVLPSHLWSALPFSEWRQQPHWFFDNRVSAGPFLLDSWSPQQNLVLVRNPSYFEPGLPRLERIVFRHGADLSTLLGWLLAGETDFVPRVAPADATRVSSDPNLRLLSYQTRQFTFLSWNTLRPQFQQPAVRRALAMAIDRETIVETLWHGYARVASSPIVSSFWAHNEDLVPWPHDPGEARSILTEQGWIDRDGDGIRERDGVRFSFELTTNPGDELRWDAMQMIRAQLLEVGIEAKPRRIEYQTLSSLNLSHDYDATVTAFLMDTTLDLGYAFHSDAIDNGYNFGSYRNDEVDRLIEEVNAKIDPLEAGPPLARIQEILHQEQPVLFLWEPDNLVGTSAELQNVAPNMITEYYQLLKWSKSAAARE